MDFGVISGAIICILGLIGVILVTIGLALNERRGQRGVVVFGGVVCSLLSVGALMFVLFPFSSDYLSYHNESGTVTAISSRFLSSGSGSSATVNQRYAVNIAGKGIFGCDDTRCSVIKPGDRIVLSCEKEWQWHGTPGWVCQFGAAYSPTGLRIA